MSYIGKNPKFNSTVFTDIGNAAVDNPASGSHRLVNRNGGLVLRDSTGVEISAGGGSTAIKITQTSHGYVVGDVLYFDGTNYLKAIASAANTSEVVGVVSKVINANSFELTTAGQVTDLAGLTAGTVYFLSPTVAGAWTATEPTTIGQVSLPLGVASATTKLIVAIKRGVVVGGTNARAVVALANNATTTIQNVSAYDAGEVTGWVSIAATTPLKFYVSAPFAKNGAGTDYNISPSYLGDTPPVGFSITVTSGGLIQATLPSVAGFVSASINYALNAPAVGATFPLSVSARTVLGDTSGTAVPAGYVGQVVTATLSFPAPVASTAKTAATLSLNKGVYMVYAQLALMLGSGYVMGTDNYFSCSISLTNDTTENPSATYSSAGPVINSGRTASITRVVVITTDSTPVYLVSNNGLTTVGTSNYSATFSQFYAVRIA